MVGRIMVMVITSLTPVVGWSSWSLMWVVVVVSSTKVVVGRMAVVDVGGDGCIVDAGGGASGKIDNAIYHNILPLVTIYCYLLSIMHYMHKSHQWRP